MQSHLTQANCNFINCLFFNVMNSILRKNKTYFTGLFGCLIVMISQPSGQACDLCSIYSGEGAKGHRGTGFYTALATQYTNFDTLQLDGDEIPNPAGEHIDSWITQAVFGYRYSRWAVQINAPYIYRSFTRLTEEGVESSHVSGFGDATILGSYRLFNEFEDDWNFAQDLLFGIKLPTGSTDRLGEEGGEGEEGHHDDDEGHGHGHDASGIHGHDLTLGSGSVDYVLGTSLFARYRRFFLEGNILWAIRTEGDYDYEFANDLMWDIGPGYYLILDEDRTLQLSVVVSGEYKGLDTSKGVPEPGSDITAWYIGPKAAATFGDQLALEIRGEIPVSIGNSGLSMVPDYRIKAGIVFHF